MVSNRAKSISVYLPTKYETVSFCDYSFRVWEGPIAGDYKEHGIRILPAHKGEYLFREIESNNSDANHFMYLISGASLEDAIYRLRVDWLDCQDSNRKLLWSCEAVRPSMHELVVHTKGAAVSNQMQDLLVTLCKELSLGVHGKSVRVEVYKEEDNKKDIFIVVPQRESDPHILLCKAVHEMKEWGGYDTVHEFLVEEKGKRVDYYKKC
jgi:hypothetical protein